MSQRKGSLRRTEANHAGHIEVRIASDALAFVKRAAEIQGCSLSDFVVTAAQEAAQRIIDETQIIRLSAEGQRLFAETILNPPKPNKALRRTFEAHKRLIAECR
jgi:uncharacterized protein (DUF1778 family)